MPRKTTYSENYTRLDAAIEALKFGKLRKVQKQGRKFDYYHVERQENGRKGGITHRVTMMDNLGIYCTCPDFQERKEEVSPCVHIQGAELMNLAKV